VVDNALTMVGVRKIGVTTKFVQAEEFGFLHDVNQLFFDSVDPDDFFIDMTVKRYEQAAYMGDWYWVSLDAAKEEERFDKKARSKLTACHRLRRNEDGTVDASQIGLSHDPTPEDVEDQVCLGDVWLPKAGLIITIARDQDDLLLESKPCDGPERGPYDLLGFDFVASHLIPLAPLTLGLALHKLANAMYVKLSDQARGQKTIGVGELGNDDDNNIVKNAVDGDFVRLGNPNAAKELSLGGVHQPSVAFLLDVVQQFNKHMGNPDILSGLGPQSPTATQDEMLEENASVMILDMEKATADFVSRALEDLGWYHWVDPDHTMRSAVAVPGTNQSIMAALTPQDREGDDWQYNFDIQPFSLRYITPEMHLRNIIQFLNRMERHLPFMQQQGIVLDYNRLVELYAEYTNTPQIKEVLRSINPEQAGVPPVGQQGGMPANTTRTYERVSRPGATDRGNSQVLQQLMSGGNPQDAQMRALLGQTAG
jgi:hypothetical protein